MILVVASKKDVASLNISQQILKHFSFRKSPEKFQQSPMYDADIDGKDVHLITLSEESIYGQDLAGLFENPELIVFVSKHRSVSGTPTLSVHTPGNLGQAGFGGLPRRVSVSPANAMRDALKAMAKFKVEMSVDYEVSYECTHHGPSLNVPAMFVELGSSPEQWEDLQAAEVVARAAMEAVSKFGSFQAEAVVGIGGPHYSGKFTRMALENALAFGHIVPKYAVPIADLEMLRQCVERTLERVEMVTLDWKGIRGNDKLQLVEILSENGISFRKV